MRCFNCLNSDFYDGKLICNFFRLGPVLVTGEVCRSIGFRSVFAITANDVLEINADYPSHPDRIMIRKKKYLKDDIREKDIWEYYDKVKRHLIVFFKDKDVALQVKTDSGTILKRHESPKEKKYLFISDIKMFDKLNTGRNIAWFIGEREETNIGIIDTDPGEGVGFEKIKDYTFEVGNAVKELDFVKSLNYLFTGKRGFHIWLFLKRRRKIDDVRERLEEFLTERYSDSNITITKKPKKGQIRMDISINKEAGLHVSPLSLRYETGLVAWWVPERNIRRFNKEAYTMNKILLLIKKGE